jgi:hypothetical protein
MGLAGALGLEVDRRGQPLEESGDPGRIGKGSDAGHDGGSEEFVESGGPSRQ